MMMIENKFNIGEKVFLITEPEQWERIITGIFIDSNNIMYRLAYGSTVSLHYDYEISRDRKWARFPKKNLSNK